MKHKFYNQGIGLIEVLVALLVMGLGILGFAALQLNSVKTSEDTYASGQAIAVAQDVIERIKANTGGIGAYKNKSWEISTNSASQSIKCIVSSYGDKTSDTKVDETKACNADEMVNHDIAQVGGYLKAVLPRGEIAVYPSCLGSLNSCVVVAWGGSDAKLGTGEDECNPDVVDTSENPSDAKSTRCVVVEFVAQNRYVNAGGNGSDDSDDEGDN